MPFTLRVEPDGVAIGTCSGVLQPADAREGASTLWRHPGWNGKAVVWDLREARLDVTRQDVREVARFILESEPAPTPLVAFVTGRDVDYGMARMFEAFRERPGTNVGVFRDYDKALAWARSGGVEEG